MDEAEAARKIESSHGEWDIDPVTVHGVNEHGETIAEIVGVPALTARNVALWTGRREWAIRVQLDAIERRRWRGKRTAGLLARLLRPVRGHRFVDTWPVTKLSYARVDRLTFGGCVVARRGEFGEGTVRE